MKHVTWVLVSPDQNRPFRNEHPSTPSTPSQGLYNFTQNVGEDFLSFACQIVSWLINFSKQLVGICKISCQRTWAWPMPWPYADDTLRVWPYIIMILRFIGSSLKCDEWKLSRWRGSAKSRRSNWDEQVQYRVFNPAGCLGSINANVATREECSTSIRTRAWWYGRLVRIKRDLSRWTLLFQVSAPPYVFACLPKEEHKNDAIQSSYIFFEPWSHNIKRWSWP